MSKRKTIGVLIGGIMDEFTEPVIKGIISESLRDDLNIIVIPIKYINRDMEGLSDIYEYQYQTSLASINAENIDVLIVAADCIGCLTSEENVKAFMADLKSRNIPIILAASKIDNCPNVVFDNKTGIIDGITYLVEELGIKNICMLKSIDHNADVSERYSTFLEMMEYYKLEVKPENVISTKLSTDCCKDDCRKLLDQNPDVEAVVCVNDAVAIGLYDVMKERGLVPGKDIKIMGFDNSINGSMITPSLTTVDADALEIGRQVIRLSRLVLDGWDVGNKTVPTRFILRDSFGSFLDRENVDQRILDKAYIDRYFHRIFFKFENISKKDDFPIFIMFKTIMNIIIDYVNDKEYNADRVTFLKSKVDEFFMLGSLNYTDADVLISYVNRVRVAVLERFDKPERRIQAYETYAKILEKIAEASNEASYDYKSVMNESLLSFENLVDDTLADEGGSENSYNNILHNLKTRGIKNAYVYIYDNPVKRKQYDPFTIPDTSLMAAMSDGEILDIPQESRHITVEELFENEFMTDKKHTMVLMPLYFRDTLYGSVLYDLTDISFKSGDLLANEYSTVARVIDMLNK